MSNAFKIPSSTYEPELIPGSIKEVKTSTQRADAMSWMDPHKLKVMPGFNARVRTQDYLDYIRSIAESMKVEGFKINKPITVIVAREGAENVVYVTDGHTRHEAALLAISEGADFERVPVVFLPKSTNMVDLTVDLHKANTGRPLSTYETALVAKRLQRMNLTEAAIAERLSLAQSHVNGLLLLAGAPRSIAEMVINETLAASEAINIMRKHGGHAITVLNKAKANAEAAGQTRVTASHMPGAAFKKAMKESAPKLLDTARAISSDPGYASLNAENRERLDALLEELGRLQKDAEDALASPAEAAQTTE